VAARDSELKNRRETASKSRDPKFLELWFLKLFTMKTSE
jgi:hypothetical protein